MSDPAAVGGVEYSVPAHLQNGAGELADGVFVLHQKDDLGAAGSAGDISGRVRVAIDLLGDGGQKNSKGRSLANVDSQRITPPLCSRSEHGGKPQAGAFAGLLGCEERSKIWTCISGSIPTPVSRTDIVT